MSGQRCAAAILFRAVSAKGSEIGRLISKDKIEDDLLEESQQCADVVNAELDSLIEKIGESDG